MATLDCVTIPLSISLSIGCMTIKDCGWKTSKNYQMCCVTVSVSMDCVTIVVCVTIPLSISLSIGCMKIKDCGWKTS